MSFQKSSQSFNEFHREILKKEPMWFLFALCPKRLSGKKMW